jgi:DNA-binding transcriptional LysR family regulator
MKFNQIESFVKIAETGSFSRTAKELFLTQPTVTAHIQSLEKYYGVKLFARTTKEVVLTEDGKELYDYAKQILILQEKNGKSFS